MRQERLYGVNTPLLHTDLTVRACLAVTAKRLLTVAAELLTLDLHNPKNLLCGVCDLMHVGQTSRPRVLHILSEAILFSFANHTRPATATHCAMFQFVRTLEKCR